MEANSADLLMVTALDQVAWLFNVRGGDVSHSPVALAFALVEKEKATLYVDPSKVTPEVGAHLAEAGVGTAPYLFDRLSKDLHAVVKTGGRVWLDKEAVSVAVENAATSAVEAAAASDAAKARAKVRRKGGKGAHAADEARSDARQKKLVEGTSPLAMDKAVKNQAELAGMREAHLRDSVALASFFSWLEKEVPLRSVSEAQAGDVLLGMRGDLEGFIEPSFPTIAGANANAAIIHYRAAHDTCKEISTDTLLLLDSGGQFDCGTTDVTRTVHLGEPSPRQKDCFTRVLKGHIALDQMVFPQGTPGFVLDGFARQSLWQAGLDYRHGTGHGVGAALNVHEGPQGISPRFGNTTPIRAGMVVSNEPGYYEDGAFGIRIENLLAVHEADTENRFGGMDFLRFERLTFVPIQAKMIAMELLTESELKWLDDYHAQVWELVSPRMEEGAPRTWLEQNTRPLAEHAKMLETAK
ncbi:hypothetical protein CYMTET_17242 [Cymbomonas tetramitiformis]|uniref:Xaa-Pro aminopeptidase n=1 Tax=Cymbomonas tetramitiformis TaxID=36881 RepID=A0AAE0L7I7_9CHLO|nr:hypothetical protein CYMTET_17242 [Cymbomonas tetramitiformis]